MKVVDYTPDQAEAWDAAVRASCNGNFLHQRPFMDYHADRFIDASLMVLDERAKVLAVLPANRKGDEVTSHGGLTYGGLLMGDRLGQAQCLEALALAAAHYRSAGVRRMVYKAVPHPFHRGPAEADLYALHRMGATLLRREAGCAIDLAAPLNLTKGRRWSIRKAEQEGLTLGETKAVGPFHDLLRKVLARHRRTPTHSVAELELLMGRFPSQIRLLQATKDGELLAGVLCFDFGSALHTQYMASSDLGRDVGALELLMWNLIQPVSGRRWLNFGISTEQDGQYLNEGLMAYKESWGGRAVMHDTYVLEFKDGPGEGA